MDAERQLLKTANEIKEALFNQDTEALMELFAVDYRSFDIRGMVEGRNLTLNVYKSGGAQLELYDIDQIQVDVFGETGIITGRGKVQGRFAEQIFSHIIRFTDVYLWKNGRWRLWLSQATEIQPA